MNDVSAEKLRVDKWLWAARFFKTRSLAKAAIEGGKVQLSGQRVKVSREIAVGDQLRIRQGWDERDVIVLGLSDQRRGAPEA
ncbi:RNA-binding S4 domain-containing protein, partial [Congregibacter sp.]|uniref:RNA-binding S4 domain-containing protein n=1 Tax=Congregibacter sp. TaxID=2744308 RepID=UPI003F6CA297